MAKEKRKLERLWGKEARKLQQKEAMKKAVAKAARRRSMAGERTGVKWRAIKKEAKRWQKPGRWVQARGIGAFLGVEEIGPPKQRETVILQRKGTRVEPPKHSLVKGTGGAAGAVRPGADEQSCRHMEGVR